MLLRGRLAEVLGIEVVSAHPLAGGDVSQSYRIELADSRVVFAKTHAAPPEGGFYTTEALGLDWLRKVGSLAVPQVLAATDATPAILVLQWIDTGELLPGSDADLGRALAQLHAAGAPAFGREDGRPTGGLRLPNQPCRTWAEFYVTQRLEPLRRLAAQHQALPPEILASIDRVIDRIEILAGPREPAARLHGDLWHGNRLVDREGRNWLIDPAAHGGHREHDLAMMRLFGGFGPEAFEAYDDRFPLVDGWTKRLPLHQLSPLIVHAIKFGGHYVGRVEQALLQLR
ncbi:MAG: fructosamine kinase family protein [Acidimicrobiia bacterium]|nr:fructosamine kinase family protein [Acidimicrobiia bacterium]MDH4362805.1 fructosamine kinase family protein [Acidimicrobiia bacterium]MDH5289250.1 fructosamine kinase family protein [Acidimicrobiia bacterium]